MNENYNEIIISSGGVRGVALLGSLKSFYKIYPIERITHFTGCSVGSLFCLLLALDYTIKEIKDIIFKIDFGHFQSLKVRNLLNTCGFDDGTKFTNLIKAFIINKKYNPNITFKELYELTGRILTISVTNITKGISEYHNYLTTPDLNIVLSIRMSINIPILFTPILYNNCYYVDGGLLDPYPYFYNKDTKKIGFWLCEKYEFNFFKNEASCFVNELSNGVFFYSIELLKIIHINHINKFYKSLKKKFSKNTVFIDFDFTPNASFFISDDNKIKLLHIGKKKFKKFVNKKRLEKVNELTDNK